MARNYGRIATSIWRDPDFLTLSPDARFVYAMLVTQANISPAGILELTERRWARNVGLAVEAVTVALDELQDRAYVVIDRDTEELLIRTFVKWDGGAGNDLRRRAIAASATAISSDKLRASIAVELDRVGVSHDLTRPPQGPMPTPMAGGVEGRRVVVKEGEYEDNPQPTTHEGEPEPLGDDAEPPSPFCSKHPKGTEKPCGPCGTAKLRHAAWVKSRPQREAAARAGAEARKAVAVDCPVCEGMGIVLDAEKRPTGRRCEHRRAS